MKYIELIVCLILLTIYTSLLTNGIKTFVRLDNNNQEIEQRLNSCRFISQSFINTCDGTGFNSLIQWQKECKSLWNLEYIAWCNGKEFLPADKIKNREIIYGKWIGKDFEGEVYWENKSEN